jgi:hypothetical protein
MVKHAELKKEHFRQLNQTGRGYFKNVDKDVIGGRASVQGYKECCQPTHAGVGRDTTNDSVFFATGGGAHNKKGGASCHKKNGGGAHNKKGGASCHKKNGGGAHNKKGGASCHKKNGGAKKSKKISKVGKLLRKKGKKLSKRVKKLLGGSVCPEQNSVYTHNMNERKFGCKQNECHSAKCV